MELTKRKRSYPGTWLSDTTAIATEKPRNYDCKKYRKVYQSCCDRVLGFGNFRTLTATPTSASLQSRCVQFNRNHLRRYLRAVSLDRQTAKTRQLRGKNYICRVTVLSAMSRYCCDLCFFFPSKFTAFQSMGTLTKSLLGS